MTLQEIANDLKQIADCCEKVTSSNLLHRIPNIEHGILNIADYLENYCPFGWHPASELPVIPEGKFSVSVIAYCNTPSGIYAPVEIAYTKTGGWQYESVKWWCYPPEED